MSDTHGVALVRRLSELGRADIAAVGGKNASLGEMIGKLKDAGIRVPGGFATTAAAYWQFLAFNRLPERMAAQLGELKDDGSNLAAVGAALRQMILEAQLPPALADAIKRAYRGMGAARVAVRSSATAEDLPEASFAGQLESFLNVRGERALLDACKRCYASLFTDRAIVYRRTHGFDHMKIALSVGVQEMVRAEAAGAGVMFSIDTETGFPRTVLVNAAWGLGETVVQGTVDPDEYHEDGQGRAQFPGALATAPLVLVREAASAAPVQQFLHAYARTRRALHGTKIMRQRRGLLIQSKTPLWQPA